MPSSKDAGQYNRAFTWLVRTLTKDTSNGQDVQSWAGSTVLWGSLKELSAGKMMAWGMLQSQATMEIRLRQWPNVSFHDRLRDRKFGQLLIIDGITHDVENNELVIRCHRENDVAAGGSSS